MALLHALAFTALHELLQRVLARGLEQPITLFRTFDLGNDERLADEQKEQIEQRPRFDIRVGADLAYGVEGPAAGKDAGTSEDCLFFSAQQVVAPVDERAHGLLTR